MLPVSPLVNLSGARLIEDETFDFDFPVSPPDCGENSAASSVDCHHRTFTLDDEEVERDEVVFFGPVGHTEQCIAVAVEEKAKDNVSGWSPLSSEQHVELFKESQMLLYHLKQSHGSKSSSTSSPSTTTHTPKSKKAPPVKASSPVLEVSLNTDSLTNKELQQQSKSKRKLSDTSFMCSTYSESDLSSVNISQLSLIDKQSEHSSPEAALVVTGDTKATKQTSNNATFTLNPPESLPHNLSSVLPKGKLTPNSNGVIKFGGKSAEKQTSESEKNKKSSLLRPPLRRGIAVLSPPKRMKVCPTPENVRQSHHAVQNTRNSLVKAGSISRRSLNNPPKKSGLKPPNMNNTFNVSKTSVAPSKISGLKPVSLKSSLSLPNKTDPAGKSPGLNRTQNLTTQSGLKAPTIGLRVPSVSSMNSVTKEVKAPVSKPQLMKQNPVTLQRKTLAANRSKLTKPGESTGIKAPGPVKAVFPTKPPGSSGLQKTSAAVPVKAESATNTSKPEAMAAEGKASIQSTPVKQQKKFQPKKIFPGQVPKPQTQRLSSTPGKESISSPSHSEKRRSFLPTPKRASTSGFRSSGSSVSSIDSVISNSPAFAIKSGRPKVQHTPVGGNKENEPKRSIWSPVPRPKAITKEEEHTQCTKHTALKLKN